MSLSRRRLLQNSSAVTVGFAALRALPGCGAAAGAAEGADGAKAAAASRPATRPAEPPVVFKPDGKHLFDLPPGFKYTVVSHIGQKMDDGLWVPGKADGMCAFPGPNGRTILVRNHELTEGERKEGAFGEKYELINKIDVELLYDKGSMRYPCLGGTTNIVFDTKTQKTERVFMSLAGTQRNCAGGPTPWNTWITCEEDVSRKIDNDFYEKDHGYNFEVPATAQVGLTRPVPLTAMGRFNHEAIAVDPKTGIVYETEDRTDGLFYRFIPKTKEKLAEGGRLQALRVNEKKGADLRNFPDSQLRVAIGQSFAAEWVDVEDPYSADDEIRYWGFHMKGCARFARGEGIWHGKDGIYFACTTGGPKRRGQIWKYVPSPDEGTADEAKNRGRVELFIEPDDSSIAENADNLTIAPWGDVFLCEDHVGRRSSRSQYLLRVTPDGEVTRFGRNAYNTSEIAGVCFSPDGSTLFVNIWNPGITLAITGPWRGRARA